VVKVNVGGAARIARVVAELVASLSRRAEPLSFNAGVSEPAPRGDLRSFNASLGVIPDYAGPGRGKRGVLLAEIQAGSAAELGGLLQGDLLVGLAGQEVRNIEDLLYVLNSSKPGQTVTAVVARGARRLELKVTFREAGVRGAAARFR
jgi:S1-C subfamily serine protease